MGVLIINPPEPSSSNPGGVPTITSAAFTIPENFQVLMNLPINTDDYIYVYGDLVEV